MGVLRLANTVTAVTVPASLTSIYIFLEVWHADTFLWVQGSSLTKSSAQPNAEAGAHHRTANKGDARDCSEAFVSPHVHHSGEAEQSIIDPHASACGHGLASEK